MLRRVHLIAPLLGMNVLLFCLPAGFTFAQDAQAEATAKATKRQAAEGSARSPLNVATPTDIGALAPTNATPPPDAERLERRAGEQVGESTRGQTLILGMHVKESATGGVEVSDVGAATPAQKAGIRKGDKIISFENFKADSYRKWIDGMRRVATSAPNGSDMTVVVLRDGNPVTTKVRIPEDQTGPIKLPLGPQPVQGQNPQPNQNNTIIDNGGDANAAVGGAGALASFFNGAAEPGSEKAVAELFRTSPSHKDSDSNRNDANGQSETAATPQPRNDRVGFAGFRNDANGMLVMVDVGGLEPGNYTVSITDAGVLGNQAQGTKSVNHNAPSPAKAGAPNESGATAPATGQVQPLTAPATGNVNPSNTVPTGGSDVLPGQGATQNGQQPAETNNPMPSSLGTLTVDQSGTGRMQQVVEAVRVRSVVGQVLVIYATNQSSDAATLPPNLDPTADPGSPKSNATAAAAAQTAFEKTAANATMPVVGGRIHLLSERGPASQNVGDNAAPANE